ncbi:MAG: DUF481 domain-containing protein [Acidobacteriota bacterium]|nr:DUF481 domain-containing protein [Acidobacteriota bacterium]
MNHRLAVLLLLALFALPAVADQIVLKNGDRISGTIVKSDGKVLVLKTDYAGDVTVQMPSIAQITSSQTLYIGLKNGKTVSGKVSTEGDKLVVAAEPAPVAAPRPEVTAIRDQAEQTAYVRSLHPPLTHGWAGGINLGYALTRGNSATQNLSLAFNAARLTLHDKISLYAHTVYATNDAQGASPSTTANAVQGGARYDRNVNPKFFAFGSTDFSTDALQVLDLRSVFTGGFGYHARTGKPMMLNFLGGLNYTHETYSAASDTVPGFSRSFPAATLGEELIYKVHAATTFTQHAYFYPDFANGDDYRATFDVSAVTKLNKWLGWQTSFGNIYVTNPPSGKKRDDVMFTTGLNVSFIH